MTPLSGARPAGRTRLVKWGNSLGLRLPKHILARLDLSEGQDVDIIATDGEAVIRRARPRPTLKALLAKTKRRTSRTIVDTGPPVGKETL